MFIVPLVALFPHISYSPCSRQGHVISSSYLVMSEETCVPSGSKLKRMRVGVPALSSPDTVIGVAIF